MTTEDKVVDFVEGNIQIVIEQQYKVIEIEEVEYDRKEEGYLLKDIEDNEVEKNGQQFKRKSEEDIQSKMFNIC